MFHTYNSSIVEVEAGGSVVQWYYCQLHWESKLPWVPSWRKKKWWKAKRRKELKQIQNKPKDWNSSEFFPLRKLRTRKIHSCILQTFKEELIPGLFKLVHKTEREETLPNLFYETIYTLIPKLGKDTA